MARRPRPNQRRSRRQAPGRKRRIGAFGITVALLILAAAGLIATLSYTYDPAKYGHEMETAEAGAEAGKDDEGMGIPAQQEAEEKTAETPPAKESETTSGEPASSEASTDQAAPEQAVAEKPAEPEMPAAETRTAVNPEIPPNPTVTTTSGSQSAGAPLNSGLIPAPAPGLHEKTEAGLLPVIANDGRTALSVYARPHTDNGEPRIALIVEGMGLSRRATASAIDDLPPEVTLAFSPYAPGLQDWVQQARRRGHEVLIEIPMEPNEYPVNDPGPLALFSTLPTKVNVERLDQILGRFAGYVGGITMMGSRFVQSETALRPVLTRMSKAGLMFVDNRESNSPTAISLSDRLGLPRAFVTRRLDRRPLRAQIDSRLGELEQLAHTQTAAVGIFTALPVSIERVAAWSRRIVGSGVTLVPVSAVANRQKTIE